MSETLKYYSVGNLREAIKDMADDVPVVAAPIDENIRVALVLSIVKDGKLGDYSGNIVIFNTELIDIKSGKRIVLTGASNEQGNN